jgi:lipoprotein-anchoring transpeptidase ErfK/SrfK
MDSMKSRTALVTCLVAGAAWGLAPPATAAPRIAPRQEIVAILSGRAVRDRPNLQDKPVAFVRAERPITGERTVLPVLAEAIDSHGRAWLHVRLPGRVLGAPPPPRMGWISAANTVISSTPWRIIVDLGARRVSVYRAGHRVRSYAAIVGKPSTPTPTGEYFVEENVQLSADLPGAPFALATSDRSNVLQEFDGGPGQIAIHGLDNLGGQLGTAESHGCIRLANSAITWLAERIDPGVPVTIDAY